jgi:alpha-1,6-mannosyltransferase
VSSQLNGVGVADLPLRDRARAYLLGPSPGEEVTPHFVDPEVVAGAPGLMARYGRLALSAVAGFAGTLLIVGSAPVWYEAAASWRLTVPGVPHPGTSAQALTNFIIGLVLLGVGWIGLIGRAERAPISTRAKLISVVVVGALWCVPVLLGPPLLSHDVYSYASQGEMARRGIDPTSQGPNALKRTRWVWQVDSIWRDAPAPYGPVAVEAGKRVVQLTGDDPARAIWGFRALAMLGVIMAGVGVASIARSSKQSAAVAVAVGIASPLVLLHLIGGSHNDALMMGLLALGVAAFQRHRRWLGLALVVLATGAKVTGAAGLVFLAWNWFDDPDTPIWPRIRATLAVGVGSVATLSIMSVFAGISVGWIAALKSTGSITSTFSVSTKLGFLVASGLQTIGIPISSDLSVALFRLAGIALALAICVVLLLRSPRLGMPRALGMSMIAVVLLSPVVWPWYLAAGFALVAASGMGRWRPSYVVLIVAASAVVFPTSISPVKQLSPYQHALTLGVVVLIAIACWVAQRLATWLDERREADRLAASLSAHPAVATPPAGPGSTRVLEPSAR